MLSILFHFGGMTVSRTKRKGLLWLVLGIVLCAVGIGTFAAILYKRYVGGVCAYYDSYWLYFWSVSKANILVSVLVGCFPFFLGIGFLLED